MANRGIRYDPPLPNGRGSEWHGVDALSCFHTDFFKQAGGGGASRFLSDTVCRWRTADSRRTAIRLVESRRADFQRNRRAAIAPEIQSGCWRGSALSFRAPLELDGRRSAGPMGRSI